MARCPYCGAEVPRAYRLDLEGDIYYCPECRRVFGA